MEQENFYDSENES